jgi:hypothetical protein
MVYWLTTRAFDKQIISTQTSQTTAIKIQFFNVAQLSHVQRQGESGVSVQRDTGAFNFHLDDGKRKLPYKNVRQHKANTKQPRKRDGEVVHHSIWRDNFASNTHQSACFHAAKVPSDFEVDRCQLESGLHKVK